MQQSQLNSSNMENLVIVVPRIGLVQDTLRQYTQEGWRVRSVTAEIVSCSISSVGNYSSVDSREARGGFVFVLEK
jgi:hypothetical protein